MKDGATPASGALTDLHQDLIGTFSGTALTASTAYTPFGETVAQTGTKTSLGYQSAYTDPDTGTVNMHARWYQPGTSTFTSRDDWTLPATPSVQANRYTYGNASPLNYGDPNGHEPCRNLDADDERARDNRSLQIRSGWSAPRPNPACTGIPPSADPNANRGSDGKKKGDSGKSQGRRWYRRARAGQAARRRR